MSDPRLREMGLVSELPVWGDTRLGGGRFSENSGMAHVLVDSPTSPNDDVRDGVRGEWGYACEGDCGTTGDIGAMIPSALRDGDRRRPGIKPDKSRGSKERVLCIVGGKDDAVMEGEFTESRLPSRASIRTHRGAKLLGQLTGCRQRVVIGAQAEEKEQRCEPDADPEEGRHVTKGWRFHHGPAAAICLSRHLTLLVCDACEVEEPHEMVDDDKNARRDERWRGEGDDWPRVGEILQVNNVAEYGERKLVKGQGVCECQ